MIEDEFTDRRKKIPGWKDWFDIGYSNMTPEQQTEYMAWMEGHKYAGFLGDPDDVVEEMQIVVRPPTIPDDVPLPVAGEQLPPLTDAERRLYRAVFGVDPLP